MRIKNHATAQVLTFSKTHLTYLEVHHSQAIGNSLTGSVQRQGAQTLYIMVFRGLPFSNLVSGHILF